MKTLLTIITLLVLTTCRAQYLPSDSSFYMSQPPVTELELRVRRLEVCTQAFEKQARIGKHMLLGSAVCLVYGNARLTKNNFDALGWLSGLVGMVGVTTANIMIFDAPRVLRAEKDRKRRDP